MAESDSEITVTFMLTEKDLLRLNWTTLRRHKVVKAMAIFLGAGCLIIFPCLVLQALNSEDMELLRLAPTILALPIAIFVGLPLMIRWAVRKAYRNNPAVRQETTYIFSAHGIQFSNDLTRSDTKWGAIIEVLETKQDFFLFTSNQTALLLPKDALPTPEERQRLRRLVEDNAGDRVSLLHECAERE